MPSGWVEETPLEALSDVDVLENDVVVQADLRPSTPVGLLRRGMTAPVLEESRVGSKTSKFAGSVGPSHAISRPPSIMSMSQGRQTQTHYCSEASLRPGETDSAADECHLLRQAVEEAVQSSFRRCSKEFLISELKDSIRSLGESMRSYFRQELQQLQRTSPKLTSLPAAQVTPLHLPPAAPMGGTTSRCSIDATDDALLQPLKLFGTADAFSKKKVPEKSTLSVPTNTSKVRRKSMPHVLWKAQDAPGNPFTRGLSRDGLQLQAQASKESGGAESSCVSVASSAQKFARHGPKDDSSLNSVKYHSERVAATHTRVPKIGVVNGETRSQSPKQRRCENGGGSGTEGEEGWRIADSEDTSSIQVIRCEHGGTAVSSERSILTRQPQKNVTMVTMLPILPVPVDSPSGEHGGADSCGHSSADYSDATPRTIISPGSTSRHKEWSETEEPTRRDQQDGQWMSEITLPSAVTVSEETKEVFATAKRKPQEGGRHSAVGEHPSPADVTPRTRRRIGRESRLSIADKKVLLKNAAGHIKRVRDSVVYVGGSLLEDLEEAEKNPDGIFSRIDEYLWDQVANVVLAPGFDYCSAFMIVMNAFLVGMQTDYVANNIGRPTPTLFRIFDVMFCVVFTTELMLRSYILRMCFFRLPDWKWNVFDTILVLMQLVEEGIAFWVASQPEAGDDVLQEGGGPSLNFSFMRVLRILRLIRIVRLFRVLRVVSELRTIVASIIGCMRPLVSAMVLLVLMMYVVGVFFTQAVSQHMEENKGFAVDRELEAHFGSLSRSMFSLYQAILGGIDWGDMANPLVSNLSAVYGLLFALYIAFACLAMMNVMTGVFVEAALNIAKKDEDSYMVNHLRMLLKVTDQDDNGVISWNEFADQLDNPSMIEYFKCIDVDIGEARSLFNILDQEETGYIPCDSFVNGCLRLRGPARALDLEILSLQSRRVAKKTFVITKRVEAQVQAVGLHLQQLQATCQMMGDALSGHLASQLTIIAPPEAACDEEGVVPRVTNPLAVS
eukprot:TRINITY_DN90707_c0_g1_i1.p1 TRINITY_DN90707_c0_g1~~TRINITY_DN90707_c0_g1_i1.p1  ORF type:complete len:1011 (+),score=253.99 TRINITY_DN90707_c0_g1_i1:137-3169(+)